MLRGPRRWDPGAEVLGWGHGGVRGEAGTLEAHGVAVPSQVQSGWSLDGPAALVRAALSHQCPLSARGPWVSTRRALGRVFLCRQLVTQQP